MQNIGTYFEIPVNDLERAMKFYSHVFGCGFSKDVIHGNEMAFFPFNEGSGITGALAKGDIYKPSTSGTLIYLATADIEDALRRIVEKGGEILFPKTEVPNYGWVAEFKDSEGNRIALFNKKISY
jgi:predicted enzyme related to lactoylglutathione lyase